MNRFCQVLLVLACLPGIAAGKGPDILTLDSHIDIPVTLGTAQADPGLDGPMQVDIPKMRRGGLDAGFFIVYVGQGELDEHGYAQAYQRAMQKFEAIERTLSRYPQDLALAASPQELQQVVEGGRLAIAVGVENAYPLGPDLEHLQEFYRRGARYVSLTHVGHNQMADSSMEKGESGWGATKDARGLADTGKRLVAELNRLGVMIDVSHASRGATLEAAALSSAPVIASHSGVKALFDHPRNLSDEEIKAIAQTGGVIQLVAFDSYMRELDEDNKAAIADIREELGLDAPDWYLHASEEQRGEMRRRVNALDGHWPRATVQTLVDHIDYVVALVGIDHAGIASDFGGGGGVKGWDDAAQTEAVTAELLGRGYSAEQVRKIWSGNLLRVWSGVEATAER